jgi:hypothetical protein
MTHTRDEVAGTVEPGRLHQYLLSRGWRDVATAEGDAGGAVARRVALRFEGAEVPLTVPSVRALADYERRVAEVIAVLAVVERRPESAVVADLLRPSADLLRLRLASTQTDLGAVSLRLALQVRTAAWQLLLAASHSALAPRSVHPRLSVRDAVAFVESCLEGPTERGSFVTSVIVPVAAPIVPNEEVEPFARRVTRTMMSALELVRTSVERDDAAALLSPDAAAAGASANLLDALASLDESGARGFVLDTSVQWAVERPAATPSSVVSLDGRVFPRLRVIAEELRHRAPPPAGELVGYVLGVRREKNEPGAPGDVVLHGVLDGVDGPIRASASLDSETYRRAAEAHARCERVRVHGALRRRGRGWDFAAVTAFEVEPSEG